MDRRRFLTGLAASALAAPANSSPDRSCSARLLIDYDAPGRLIPSDFIGLSYESAVVAAGQYFTNPSVLGLIGGLSREGVIRVGGNTSERTVWRTDSSSGLPDAFVISPASIDALARAVRILGWQVIYGLNLARGQADDAAEEAAYVSNALGPRLIAFQISNEPDGFGRWSGVRSSSYNVGGFLGEWRVFHAAVRARVPQAAFAGPDVAFETSWVAALGNAAPPGLVLLTRHYYADGPATDDRVTLANLLASAPAVEPVLAELEQYGRTYRLPYRIAETNSVFSGGRHGVSDTFGAALWGLELMGQVAAAGGAGVNFHSGDDKVYSPIALAEAGRYKAQPLYYGMLLFAQTCRGALLPIRFEPRTRDVSAFASRDGSQWRIALINKNPANAFCVRLSSAPQFRNATLLRLIAPTLEATSGITFGGASVDAFGAWSAANKESASVENGDLYFDLPAGSAAAVFLTER